MSTGLAIGSLFSGYGGLDQGVQAVLGGRVVWCSDINPGACKILAHRYPEAPNLGDVTRIDWTTVAPIDVLCAGFPCQDVSKSGRRSGLRPGTRSGLWSHVAYAIDVLHPRLVMIENVRGLLSASAASDVEPCPVCVGDTPGGALRAFGAVLGDLAELGYRAAWLCSRASDSGAPHERERCFLAASPADPDRLAQRPLMGGPPGHQGQERSARAGHHGGAGHSVAVHPDGVARAGVNGWAEHSPTIAVWESVTGHAAPAVTAPQSVIAEWMMGLEPGWVTAVPDLSESAQNHALGNGVVPQQAAAALTALLPVLEAAA